MQRSFLISIIALITLAACKYEDGPKVSFRTKKARLVNIWYLEKVYEAGVDRTTDYKNVFVNYRFEVKQDDSYNLSYRFNSLITVNENGTWKLSGDKKDLLLTPNNSSQTNSYKILRLKNHEFNVRYNFNGDEIELHLKD